MEKIVLKGEIEFADLGIYDKMVSEPDVKFIDIKDFTLKEENEWEWQGYYKGRDERPPVTLALYIAKQMSSSFIVENGLIMSPDRKTVYYGFDKDEIIIPKGVEIIAKRAFYLSTIREITFPKTLKRIEEFAFAECENLIEIELPDSVDFVGESAFEHCSLKNVSLSSKLKTITADCFAFNNLTNLMLPPNIKTIEFGAFMCNWITRVLLPEGVEEIQTEAFTALDYICFPSTMRIISETFYYESDINYGEERLPYIDVNKKNPYFFGRNGTLYSRKNPEKPYLGFIYKNKN